MPPVESKVEKCVGHATYLDSPEPEVCNNKPNPKGYPPELCTACQEVVNYSTGLM